ncbi:decaprenyl-phosphate phosphoribosyltransferase [Oryzihumus sp.]|jgi:decaprenyl-phosphate phosphoribosyltransferase|uniref:decaprenyl-phosphate phosphoribosyltransferase n=1 Tax=Oryzihumus sp. TaxID=1968903 RepID=UPI002ED80403
MTVWGGLVRTARPQQWTKNILVLVAPAAAGVLLQPERLAAALTAGAAFCLASSGVYFINDVRDVRADRLHPQKCRRPVAAGVVPVPTALAAGVILLLCALGVSAAVSSALVLVLLTYEVVQVTYCLGLKDQPVLELVSVASGFLLRAVAGGVAVAVPLSPWFLVTAGFGSLFMAAGKRYAEAQLVGRTGLAVRPVLRHYTLTYLRFVWTLAAGVLVTTYSLWAFSVHDLSDREQSTWNVVSIIPFVTAVLRYAVNVDSGEAGEPEQIALHDRVLLLLGVLWAAALGASVYG